MEGYRVDRIEEGFFVCIGADGETLNIPRECLPDGVSEGWIVTVSEDGDGKACEAREPDGGALMKNRARFDKLFKKKY